MTVCFESLLHQLEILLCIHFMHKLHSFYAFCACTSTQHKSQLGDNSTGTGITWDYNNWDIYMEIKLIYFFHLFVHLSLSDA